LISAEGTDEYEYTEENRKKAKKFRYEDMDGYYIVFERPGLQTFLDYLFKNCNVSVWTAASKTYALFVIDKILINGHKDRNIDYIFFSYHCDKARKIIGGVKNLNFLWNVIKLKKYTPENTLIIDDREDVHQTQPHNSIFIRPFYFTEKNSHLDKELIQVKKQILKFKKSKNIKVES
jgi:hypothetical protein